MYLTSKQTKGVINMNNTQTNTIRFWSLVSGISLLIMTLAAGYAFGVSFNQLYVPNDNALTLLNVEQNNTLFLTGILAWTIILITDFIVSYGFYRYLLPINKTWAVASGILRATYSVFLGIAIVFLSFKNFENFQYIWTAGLIAFGFHLAATGIGTLHSEKIPKILGILLIIAGVSYSLVSGLQILAPRLENFTTSLNSILAVPMMIGELSFGVWLLVRGGKEKQIKIQPQVSYK